MGDAVRAWIVFLAVCFCVFAQGTNLGTIRGTITDPSGAVIPNATVQVVDTGTGVEMRFVSDVEGNYEARALKYGVYKLIISAPGFARTEIDGLRIRAAETVRADAQLQTSALVETVVITSQAAPLETERPTISGVLDTQLVTELPRDSRDIYTFLYLNPNIMQGDSDGTFKFLGAQTWGASFSLDGQRSNGGVFGQPTASQPSLEAVGELVVMSHAFTAEYAGIANIRVETRRGQQQYRGSLFYNNRNSALMAWRLRDKIAAGSFIPNPFQSKYPTPYSNLNEFGASLGGPLPKVRKTFFFAAYERRYSAAPVNFQSTTLPHPRLWDGDFSGLNESVRPAVPAGIELTAAEVAQYTVRGEGRIFNRIPPRLINPVTKKMIDLYFPVISRDYPINAANGRLPAYFSSMPGLITRDLGTIRVDHDFSERNRVFWVYNTQALNGRSAAVVSPFTGLGLTKQDNANHTFSVSYLHFFSARTFNEARAGFNIQYSFRQSNQTLRQFLANIGFTEADIAAYGAVVGNTLDTPGHPAVNFGTGFQNFTNGGRNTYRPLDQKLTTFGDTFSWIKGRHTVKAGFDVVRNAAVDGFSANRGNPRGLIRYTGAGPTAFARFLMGLPANAVSFNSQPRGPMDVWNWEHGYFVQDDFKVSQRLTIYVGLRYELITPFREASDLLVNLDPAYKDPVSGKKGRFIIPSRSVIDRIDPRMVAWGIATADEVGVGRSLVKTDYDTVAPRVGAAFRLTPKMVVRGGYGLFYPTSAAQAMRDAMATNPFNQSRTKNATTASPLAPWPGFAHGFSPMDGGVLSALSGSPAANAIPFDIRTPRIHQYNFTFERDLGWRTSVRASYLGTLMHRLISGIDLNLLPPSDIPFGTSTGDGVTPCDPYLGNCNLSPADIARYPLPGLGTYLASFGNLGHGRSHAFQLEFRRSWFKGLTFNASYTRLDQQSSAGDTGNSNMGASAYNPFRPDSDFGRDSFVPSHRFIFYSIYEIPVGRRRAFGRNMPKWAEYLAGGWNTSWQAFARSGSGLTPYWTCDNCIVTYPGNVGSEFIDATGGLAGTSFRPLVLKNPNVKSGDRIYDPEAFGPPPVGADLLDNPLVAKRNMLEAPGTWGINLGVRKIYRFGERVRAELGADFNNLLNHPLRSPSQSGYTLAYLGSFSVSVDPKTMKLNPITQLNRNTDFGRLINTYTQEGVDDRRTVRLRLRITF